MELVTEHHHNCQRYYEKSETSFEVRILPTHKCSGVVLVVLHAVRTPKPLHTQ